MSPLTQGLNYRSACDLTGYCGDAFKVYEIFDDHGINIPVRCNNKRIIILTMQLGGKYFQKCSLIIKPRMEDWRSDG